MMIGSVIYAKISKKMADISDAVFAQKEAEP